MCCLFTKSSRKSSSPLASPSPRVPESCVPESHVPAFLSPGVPESRRPRVPASPSPGVPESHVLASQLPKCHVLVPVPNPRPTFSVSHRKIQIQINSKVEFGELEFEEHAKQ